MTGTQEQAEGGKGGGGRTGGSRRKKQARRVGRRDERRRLVGGRVLATFRWMALRAVRGVGSGCMRGKLSRRMMLMGGW